MDPLEKILTRLIELILSAVIVIGLIYLYFYK